MYQTWSQFNSGIEGQFQFQKFKLATKKKTTPSTYSKQASIEKRLSPYELMDDFKPATTLDPRFELDWCQNDESCDVHDLLTSQVVGMSSTTPAEFMELNCFIWS